MKYNIKCTKCGKKFLGDTQNNNPICPECSKKDKFQDAKTVISKSKIHVGDNINIPEKKSKLTFDIIIGYVFYYALMLFLAGFVIKFIIFFIKINTN